MQPIVSSVNATTPSGPPTPTTGDPRPPSPVARTSEASPPAAAAVVTDESQLKKAVDSANAAIKDISSDLEFSADPSTGKTIVRVIDRSTQQVIRQIPSEEMLAISKAIDRVQGILIRHKA